ncbi:MAG: hypothetical protein PHH58_03205 [Rhodoferax sp.]|nr:hypothetical protein [Rhodoferax sp.]
MARTRHDALRWLFLKNLHADTRYASTDSALLNIARSEYPDATLTEVRRELQYLFLAKLLTLTEKKSRWLLQLTRDGVDIAEYTIQCPPGIGRPAPGSNWV